MAKLLAIKQYANDDTAAKYCLANYYGLYHFNSSAGKNEGIIRLDLSAWENRIYFCSIRAGGAIHSTSFLKEK